MGVTLFVLFGCFAAMYAVQFEMEQKTLENNPYLNSEDLGALQDAWKTIYSAADQDYYLVFLTVNRRGYEHLKCKRVRTHDVNATRKTAYYNITEVNYNKILCTDEVKSTEGFVEALKQTDYNNENVMRYWFDGESPQRSERRSPNGSYTIFLHSEPHYCEERDWQLSWRKKDQFDEYVVFSQESCYITRNESVHWGSCQLWMSAKWLNETSMESGVDENIKPTSEGRGGNPIDPKWDLFRKVPRNCRSAFLMVCGYPTFLTYSKEKCDKIK